MNNLVSIIVPVYNAGKYLSETLNSVEQTYKNWECLLIDDGSTDSSKEIAKKYCKKDSRFKYYYQQNSGPSVARNLGLQKSAGDFIQFLDADDVLKLEFLNVLLLESQNVASNIILYSGFLIGKSDDIYITSKIDRQFTLGKDHSFKEFYNNFGLNFTFIPGCVLFPKKALENAKWDVQLSHSEDWDLYLQISNSGFAFRNIPQELFIYRNTPNSLSKQTSNTLQSNYKILNVWKSKTMFAFSRRCAISLKKNIFLFATNKVDKIINPFNIIDTSSIKNYFEVIFIILLTVYYVIVEMFQILIKKLSK